MTLDQYRARIRSFGLTPCMPSINRHTPHRDREGEVWSIPDPEHLGPEERSAYIGLLKSLLNIVEH